MAFGFIYVRTMGILLVILPLLLLIGVSVWLYNCLVRCRNRVKEAWSGIDVQLKRRHDLIPNLVRTVDAYASHERNLLQEVTRLRSETLKATGVDSVQHAENDLSHSLGALLVLVENYPDLKADKNFLDLHNRLVEVEDHLQMARRYYNGSVRDMNNLVESVPTNLIAKIFGFRLQAFFKLDSALERNVPEVRLSAGGM